jgi:hypothetical protein
MSLGRDPVNEASLEAIGTAVTVMRIAALTHTRQAASSEGPIDDDALQIRAHFDDLTRHLSATRDSCAAVRELIGPRLATAELDRGQRGA